PGTPIWAHIQTEPDAQAVAAWNALAGEELPPVGVDARQIRMLVLGSVAAGARGLVFDSRSPLTSHDKPTRLRALMLHYVNLELDLIRPWIASGNYVTSVISSDRLLQGETLQTDRTRLLLPLHHGTHDQFQPEPVASAPTYVVPGIPDSNNAYLLTPAALRA